MDPLQRRAARLLVIDPENSVLLFQYEDDRLKWWATPGGPATMLPTTSGAVTLTPRFAMRTLSSTLASSRSTTLDPAGAAT